MDAEDVVLGVVHVAPVGMFSPSRCMIAPLMPGWSSGPVMSPMYGLPVIPLQSSVAQAKTSV